MRASCGFMRKEFTRCRAARRAMSPRPRKGSGATAVGATLSGGSLALVVIGWFSFVRPARRWGDQLDIARATAELAMAQLRDKQVELELLNERLYTQARIDPLTGLNTRLSFNEDAQGIGAANPAPNLYCAVMCDVDFFKQYNDSCGHLAGDRVSGWSPTRSSRRDGPMTVSTAWAARNSWW